MFGLADIQRERERERGNPEPGPYTYVHTYVCACIHTDNLEPGQEFDLSHHYLDCGDQPGETITALTCIQVCIENL